MLIEIDRSAIDGAIATGGSSATSIECIENLLRAHHAGKHVVSIEQEHADALAPISAALSARARGALVSIKAQQTEIRGLRGRLRWRMRVGLGRAFNGASVTQAGKEILQASLHDFHDFERLSQAVLLGENLTDAALYRTMGKAFIALRGWNVRLAFEERGGGGSTTAPAFEKLVSDGKIVLAIADSDRKYPDGPLGSTAARLLRVQKKAFQHVHVLHVRFAENLLSSAVYKEAFESQKVKQAKLDGLARLMQMEKIGSAVPWREHAELKHGLKLFEVRAMTAGSAEATFWSAAAAMDPQRDHCQQERSAPCTKVEDCRCYVTDALGKDALDLAVAWMAPRDPRRNARLLGIAGNTPAGDLCEKLLAWGIAMAARPV
jgi:hypothetical protein